MLSNFCGPEYIPGIRPALKMTFFGTVALPFFYFILQHSIQCNLKVQVGKCYITHNLLDGLISACFIKKDPW